MDPQWWGTMGSPYGDAYRNSWMFRHDWPYGPSSSPSQRGAYDFTDLGGSIAPPPAMMMPNIQPPPLPGLPPTPGAVGDMPGYATSKFDLQQAFNAARKEASTGRRDTGQQHVQNIAQIGSNTAERGIAFSGAHEQLNTKENDAYAKVLAAIAAKLQGAQQSYSQGLAGLAAQNAGWQIGQGMPNIPNPGPGGPLGNIAAILATIRGKESGGNYMAENPYSTASGAYQFTDPTWAGLLREFGLSGPGHAASAGRSLQDLVATDYARQILSQHGGNVSYIPQIWHWGGGGYQSHPWDSYDARWMDLYRQLYGNQGYGGGGSQQRYQ